MQRHSNKYLTIGVSEASPSPFSSRILAAICCCNAKHPTYSAATSKSTLPAAGPTSGMAEVVSALLLSISSGTCKGQQQQRAVLQVSLLLASMS